MAGILNTIFIVCLVIGILFFVISVALFFLFDIWYIFNIRTGRAAAKSVKDMESGFANTGHLRTSKGARSASGKKDHTPKPATPAGQAAPAYQAPPSAAQAEYPSYERTPDTELSASADASDTELLYSDQQTPEPAEQYGRTEGLGPDSASETSVLNAAETSVLNAGAYNTAADGLSAELADDEDIFFDVIKKIIVRDTDEIIR